MALAWQRLVVDTGPVLGEVFDADPGDVLDRVLELLERPEWHRRAACRDEDPHLWFPRRGESLEPGRALCRECPVSAECLQAALDVSPSDDFGMWAGTSARERQRMRRNAA